MAKQQLDLITLNKMTERETRNIARQEAALKQTLAEINIVEEAEKKTPGAYGNALNKLRTKRDRQNANLNATKAYLEAIKT